MTDLYGMLHRAPIAAALSSVALLALFACKGGVEGDETKSDAAQAPASPAAPTSPANPDEEIVPQRDAANVSGAFLASCSDDTQTSFVKNADDADTVSACFLENAKAEAATVENVTVTAIKHDGTRATPEVVVKEVDNAPWQVGFRLAPADVGTIASVEISYNEVGKTPVSASATGLAFDWTKHPAFKLFYDFVTTVAVFASSREKIAFDFFGKRDNPDAPRHIIFGTNGLHTAELGGLEGADALCAAAAAEIPGNLTWRALLSTTTVNARDRVPLKGEIVNYTGGTIAYPETFWTEKHKGAVAYTETGASIQAPVENSDRIRFELMAWTGTRHDGTYDGSGACADWTSSATGLVGGVGDSDTPGVADKSWIEAKLRSCAKTARLLCISL